MSNHADRGRDGCRVPLPWKVDPSGAFGFSSNSSLTPTQAWLPQSSWWGSYAVETQEGQPNSTLTMYQNALKLRHAEVGLGDGPLTWIETGESVLAFSRPGDFACYVNFGIPIMLPEISKVLLSSGPLDGVLIPTDTAVWLRLAAN
jgi:alpha-glucosidase